MKHRVAVTGMGVVCPLGASVNEFWNNLVNGKNGIRRLEGIYSDLYKEVSEQLKLKKDLSYIGGAATKNGEVIDEKMLLDMYLSSPRMKGRRNVKEFRRLGRTTLMALLAKDEALEDANLRFVDDYTYNTAVIVASGISEGNALEKAAINLKENRLNKINMFTIPQVMINAASGNIAMEEGIHGPNYATSSACASSLHSIDAVIDKIRLGRIKVGIAGGTEAPLFGVAFYCFNLMKALSTNPNPECASRPFDYERDGFVMAEGAAVIVLEEMIHAKARGAKIYAEILGYGETCDAKSIAIPEESGKYAAQAMKIAIANARIKPSDIDYINAHGTSTPAGDIAETKAIKNVFGDYSKNVKVSSTKSMHGHLLGAAGALETIVCIKALNEGIIPPTINYKTPDPNCDLDYTPNKAIKKEIKYALNNSFGFGGTNASIVIKKYEK